MKFLSRKLRQKNGSSMLIAMVFMLFCVFVGGSVLTAATANGSRVARLSQQQDFLNQRSAALLVADELRDPAGFTLNMMIYDDTSVATEIQVGNGGVIVDKPGGQVVTSRTITFRLPDGTSLTPFQRVMAELTVWRYCKDNAVSKDGALIRFINFWYGSDGSAKELTNLSEFWLQFDLISGNPKEGSVTTAVKNSMNAPIADFQARYSIGTGAEDLYDFSVDFGASSQLQVRRNAISSTNPSLHTEMITDRPLPDGSKFAARVNTDAKTIVVSWQQPMIEKGGAA